MELNNLTTVVVGVAPTVKRPKTLRLEAGGWLLTLSVEPEVIDTTGEEVGVSPREDNTSHLALVG